MSATAADSDREALIRFRAALAADLDLRRVFPSAVREVRELLGFDGCALLALEPERNCLRLFATSLPIPDRVEISLQDQGTISAQALARRELVSVAETAHAQFAYDRRLAELGFRSHVAWPLVRSGRAIGTLNLTSRRPDAFAELARPALEAVGEALATALDHALLFERLQRSERRYASLVEGAREFIYQLDPGGRITFVNRAGSQLLGRPVDDMIGRQWSELVHPKESRGDALGALLTGATAELTAELALLGPGGEAIATRQRIHALRDETGALIGLQGVVHDLAREKEADRAIRLHRELVEALDDYVFMADASGRLLAINRKAREALGWDLDQIAVMTIWDLHPPEDKAMLERERWRIVESGASSFAVRLLSRSGRTIPTRGRVTYSPESGTFQGVYRDISEEQMVQDRLLQVERLRALGEMASGVAHTFNNLLAVIGTTVQVARRRTRDEAILGDLAAIEQAVYDGGAAVRRIQDFTRKPSAEPDRELDLAELLRDVGRVAAHRAEAREGPAIEIALDFAELPPVRGNDPELRDAFLNLLFNAIDALPEGGRICLRAAEREGRIVAEVEDNGRGMTPDVRSRLFTPFFSTKGERGSGLGLPIALDVVSRHGGTIEVESRQGAGTTMRVVLPVAAGAGRSTERAARVLLVSGEPLLRTQLERALAGRGHLVELAASAAEARVAFARSAFEVAFVDLDLDDASALDIADRARAGGTRVVILAGWDAKLTEDLVSAHRLDAVLRKPFPPDAALNLVHGLQPSPGPARG